MENSAFVACKKFFEKKNGLKKEFSKKSAN
jgi:hypothetical protein